MIVTRWIAARLAAIVLVAILVQGAFLSYFSILGTPPDIVPVVIAAIGLLGGAVVGAVAGFVAGLLVDSTTLETLGVSSLVLLSVGYLAGRYRESFEIENFTAPAAVAGVLSLFAAAGATALQVTLGVDTTVSSQVIGEVIVKGLLGFLFAFPVYALVRLALRSALVLEEPPTKRRLFRGSRRRRGSGRRPDSRRPRRRGPTVTRTAA